MKKGGINALEVVIDHVTGLTQRLRSTPDPHEKELLQKRIRNLEGVLAFLESTHSESRGGSYVSLHPAPSRVSFSRFQRDSQARTQIRGGNGAAA